MQKRTSVYVLGGLAILLAAALIYFLVQNPFFVLGGYRQMPGGQTFNPEGQNFNPNRGNFTPGEGNFTPGQGDQSQGGQTFNNNPGSTQSRGGGRSGMRTTGGTNRFGGRNMMGRFLLLRWGIPAGLGVLLLVDLAVLAGQVRKLKPKTAHPAAVTVTPAASGTVDQAPATAGTPIAAETPQPERPPRYCPNCHHEVKWNWVTCPYCTKPLPEEPPSA